MNKLIMTILTLTLSSLLIGCTKDSDLTENISYKNEEQFKQKVIIRDSVEAPLPPEAKNIKLMPGKLEPQQIPNADLSNPLVITKMPYFDKN